MNMEIGTETKRQIVLKYRAKLKGLLAEHEVKHGLGTHMLLLNQLCEIVEKENNYEPYRNHKD
jgi:hypothetical protein